MSPLQISYRTVYKPLQKKAYRSYPLRLLQFHCHDIICASLREAGMSQKTSVALNTIRKTAVESAAWPKAFCVLCINDSCLKWEALNSPVWIQVASYFSAGCFWALQLSLVCSAAGPDVYLRPMTIDIKKDWVEHWYIFPRKSQRRG